MARSDPQINLRVPEDLKRRLEEHARWNGRSVNAEVITRLERTLENSPMNLLDSRIRELNRHADQISSLSEEINELESRDPPITSKAGTELVYKRRERDHARAVAVQLAKEIDNLIELAKSAPAVPQERVDGSV